MLRIVSYFEKSAIETKYALVHSGHSCVLCITTAGGGAIPGRTIPLFPIYLILVVEFDLAYFILVLKTKCKTIPRNYERYIS